MYHDHRTYATVIEFNVTHGCRRVDDDLTDNEIAVGTASLLSSVNDDGTSET